MRIYSNIIKTDFDVGIFSSIKQRNPGTSFDVHVHTYMHNQDATN